MAFLNKLLTILILFVVVFFWNKYIVEYNLNSLVKFHENNNADNLDKQPIKFYIQNKTAILRFAKGFYWFGFVIITIMILIDFIPRK
jgi:hypothetical protein